MYEKLKDNSSSHSTGNIHLRKKRDIRIIVDKNLREKYGMRDSKTLSYFSTINNQTFHNINSFLKYKKTQILEYHTKYKTLEPDDDLVNIGHDDTFDQKKKVGKKVNRNLKLLNIIKERMNKEKNNENNETKKDEKNDGKNIKVNINKNRDIEIKAKEKINDKKIGDEKEKKLEKNLIDEEKKNKLLNIINSKKYNKFQRKEGKDEEKESEEKNNNNRNNSNNDIINNKSKKALNQSKSSRPYTTLNKKEEGSESDTFSIRTSRQNEKDKLYNNEEQIFNDNNNNLINKDKLNDIKKKKNKIDKIAKTIPSTINDIISTKEKGVNKNSVINNINENNKPSSKKGALKIVELLKMKKREENENTRARTQERQTKNEEKNGKVKYKNITKSIVPQKKQNLEIDSLARKNLRDEDENEFHNRTQQNFRDFKKLIIIVK